MTTSETLYAVMKRGVGAMLNPIDGEIPTGDRHGWPLAIFSTKAEADRAIAKMDAESHGAFVSEVVLTCAEQ